MEETFTIEKAELPTLVENVLARVTALETLGARVIALHGDLGAGKTTFVQALGSQLGVIEAITSPTFTIMKAYELAGQDFTTLVHMDAYRIDNINELGPLRFAELLNDPQTLLCIEWAEKIAGALPQPLVNVSLVVSGEEARTVVLS